MAARSYVTWPASAVGDLAARPNPLDMTSYWFWCDPFIARSTATGFDTVWTVAGNATLPSVTSRGAFFALNNGVTGPSIRTTEITARGYYPELRARFMSMSYTATPTWRIGFVSLAGTAGMGIEHSTANGLRAYRISGGATTYFGPFAVVPQPNAYYDLRVGYPLANNGSGVFQCTFQGETLGSGAPGNEGLCVTTAVNTGAVVGSLKLDYVSLLQHLNW